MAIAEPYLSSHPQREADVPGGSITCLHEKQNHKMMSDQISRLALASRCINGRPLDAMGTYADFHPSKLKIVGSECRGLRDVSRKRPDSQISSYALS